ncbi:MAG: hypothetical protein M0027_18965 [Candidatus Dormibacteraeota bacterium]|jgi:hypothetical protein|nr:hypothetical protein [Candidatus Dormibacteraeota bacterium]
MDERAPADTQTTHSAADFPVDIELDEAALNWIRNNAARRPGRQAAADAAVTSAISRAYA